MLAQRRARWCAHRATANALAVNAQIDRQRGTQIFSTDWWRLCDAAVEKGDGCGRDMVVARKVRLQPLLSCLIEGARIMFCHEWMKFSRGLRIAEKSGIRPGCFMILSSRTLSARFRGGVLFLATCRDRPAFRVSADDDGVVTRRCRMLAAYPVAGKVIAGAVAAIRIFCMILTSLDAPEVSSRMVTGKKSGRPLKKSSSECRWRQNSLSHGRLCE